MSFLVDLVGVAIKTVGAARRTSQAAGHETPVLEELHGGLTPVRAELMQDRTQELADTSVGTATDPRDPTETEGGFISEVIDWIANHF